MVVCKNCGGKFKNEFSYCPYCGHINEPSARKNFLNKMRGVTRDLEQLPRESKNIYKSQIKKEVKKTAKLLKIFGAVILGIVLFSLSFSLLFQEDPSDVKEEIFWEKEYFPVLDELYEKKDYQGILDFMEEHYEDPGECYFRWKHYEFLSLYEEYRYIISVRDNFEERSKKKDDHIGGWIYSAASLYFYEKNYWEESYLTEYEADLKEWKEEAEEFLYTCLEFTKEELIRFEEEAFEDGYLSYDYCRKYGNKK